MTLYVWVKASHLIFVIAWMAGLLIYPRYKLHQLSSAPGEPLFETMRLASLRLRKIILTPALLIVWALGLTLLALNTALLSNGWMHAKLLLVVVLSGLHGYFISMGRKVDAADGSITSKRLKLLNEAPFVVMIVVVILAIVKPF